MAKYYISQEDYEQLNEKNIVIFIYIYEFILFCCLYVIEMNFIYISSILNTCQRYGVYVLIYIKERHVVLT